MSDDRRKRREYDVAYACFMLCGLTALITSLVSMIPTDTGTAGAIGFLVLVPLALASIAALGCGIVMTVRLWRHTPLIALSAMSLLVVAEVATEYGSTAFYNTVPIVYGVGVIAISALWFFKLRARRFPR